jgi:hypothetical protein
MIQLFIVLRPIKSARTLWYSPGEHNISGRLARLQTVSEPAAALDSAALETSNLIDGVVNALD